MNTRLLQINQLLNDVIRDFVKTGHMPFTNEVLMEATGRVQGKILGTPQCVPDIVTPNSPTDPERYNDFFTNAVKDIKLLYDMITDQLKRTVTDMDYLMTWRQRVKNKIKTLETEIKSIGEMPPYKFQENFVNLLNVNLNNTTAYINFNEDKATLHESIRESSRVYPVIESYSVPVGYEYEDVSNIFDDSLNTMWHYQIDGDKTGASIVLSFTFKEPVEINKIFIVGFSPKPCAVSIILTTVNGSKKLYEQNCDSYDNASWYFGNIQVYGVEVYLSKTESDYIDNTKYIYNFGLQSVELYKNSYVKEGVIQSGKINFLDIVGNKQNISSLTLKAEHAIPSGCGINYYISATNQDEPLNWIEIMPGEKISLNAPMHYEYNLNKITSYPVNSSSASAIYYISGETDSVPFNYLNLKLQKVSNWRVQYYFYEVLDDDVNQYSDTNPSIDDFTEPRGEDPNIIITWTDIGVKKDVFAVAGNRKRMVMFTTYFSLDAPLSVSSGLMNMFWKESSQRSIYVNDSSVNYKTQDNKLVFQFNFIKGVNKIAIVTNDYMPSDITEFENCVLNNIQAEFYCDKYPMIQVSPYDLFYNVRQDDPSKFAVDASGRILVNHSEQIKYKVMYDHVSTSNYKCNLFYKIIMSRLSDSNVYFTPEIESLEFVVNEE